MKIPEPGWSILIDGLEPSSRPRGRKTVRDDSEVIVVIDGAEEPLGVAEPDGLMSSFFLLLSSVGALSWTATVPMKRPRALNMRKRRRAAESAIMAKTPFSILLNRMTINPIKKMMRSCNTISARKKLPMKRYTVGDIFQYIISVLGGVIRSPTA